MNFRARSLRRILRVVDKESTHGPIIFYRSEHNTINKTIDMRDWGSELDEMGFENGEAVPITHHPEELQTSPLDELEPVIGMMDVC